MGRSTWPSGKSGSRCGQQILRFPLRSPSLPGSTEEPWSPPAMATRLDLFYSFQSTHLVGRRVVHFDPLLRRALQPLASNHILGGWRHLKSNNHKHMLGHHLAPCIAESPSPSDGEPGRGDGKHVDRGRGFKVLGISSKGGELLRGQIHSSFFASRRRQESGEYLRSAEAEYQLEFSFRV